jgi:SAM-dependent methyltransferase
MRRWLRSSSWRPLPDTTRTKSYALFILSNPDLFKGATVLDVGCGTGILSLLCARAGAAHVYAVDASDVAVKAIENIKRNGCADSITVVRGKVEDIQLPDGVKVDVIVSEWMGYMCVYRSSAFQFASSLTQFRADCPLQKAVSPAFLSSEARIRCAPLTPPPPPAASTSRCSTLSSSPGIASSSRLVSWRRHRPRSCLPVSTAPSSCTTGSASGRMSTVRGPFVGRDARKSVC